MVSIIGEFRKLIFPFLETVLSLVLNIPFVGTYFDIFLSVCASLSRLFIGVWPAKGLAMCKRPTLPLVLYQYEACPFCRRVREALSVLRINVVVYPCPRTTLAQYGVEAGSRYRSEATEVAGKCIFPILVDPNITEGDSNNCIRRKKGKVILDSAAIVSYLWETYGSEATMPWNYALLGGMKSPPVLLALPSLFRVMPHNGMLKDRCVSTEVPEHLLELYTYDGCPFSRLIRERLDCLEIPYLCINENPAVGGIITRSGELVTIATPTLLDRNEDNQIISDYRTIITYLNTMYSKRVATQETFGSVWATYSTDGATADNYVLGTDANREADISRGLKSD